MQEAEFAAEVCESVSSTSITLVINGLPKLSFFRLPDCVYTHGTNLQGIFLQHLTVRGTLSSEPFLLFPTTLENFECSPCIFVDPAATVYVPNKLPMTGYAPKWSSVFARLSSLTNFMVKSSNLGGPLPSELPPQLFQFSAEDCSMSGTLPASLLNNIGNSSTQFTLNLPNNWISGTIPRLVQTNGFGLLTSLRIELSSNRLSGTLPAQLFQGTPSATSVLGSLWFDVSFNELEGSIPSPLVSGQTINTLQSITLILNDNHLNGTIPTDIYNMVVESLVSDVTLMLQNNRLTGSLESRWLFPWVNALNLNSITLDISGNMLSGPLPASLLNNPVNAPNFSAFVLFLAHNRIEGTIPATLLPSVPKTIILTIVLADNLLTGEIPQGWFNASSVNALNFNVSMNQLNGSPFGNLLNFTGGTQMTSVIIDASHNKLVGQLPDSFCGLCTLSPTTSLNLIFADNLITGNIPTSLLDYTSGMTGVQVLDFSSNQIDGSLPTTLMRPMVQTTAKRSQSLSFANNSLTGILPNKFYAGTAFKNDSSLKLDLSSNQIEGGLNPDFLVDIPAAIRTLAIKLSNNPLRGAWSNDFLAPFIYPPSPVAITVSLHVDNCELGGTIPASIVGTAAKVNLVLDHNRFGGDFPLDGILSGATYNTLGNEFIFSARNNTFLTSAKSLTFPAIPSSWTSFYVSVDLSLNLLTSINITSSASEYLRRLVVSDNTRLTGTIPNELLDTASLIQRLDASNTALSGVFFESGVTAARLLTHLNLSNTAINFCSGTRSAYTTSAVISCSLDNTQANKCQSYYPSICFSSQAGAGCSLDTRPSPQFICIDGKWTANTTIGSPTLIIPGGATQTIINADVDSSVIIFNGIGSLTISGCANNLTQIVVTLTPEQLKGIGSTKINQTLVSYTTGNTNCSDLSQVSVTLDVKGSSCRKAKVTKATSNGQLSGLFSVDSSGCNTWWIILVSVICGVIVLLVIIFILLAIFVPAVRQCLRPFSKKRRNGAGNVA